jgi:hypothetical protein
MDGAVFCTTGKASRSPRRHIGQGSTDGSSVLLIGGPLIVLQSGETMVASLEAGRVARYEMRLLNHKRAAQRPSDCSSPLPVPR